MGFITKIWHDSPSTLTPINSAALVNLESRLSNYTDAETFRAAVAESFLAPIANPVFTGITTAPAFVTTGLTGAVTSSRHVGGTASGAPVSGTFITGDWIVDQTGKRWTCTAGGSPGTWIQEPGSVGTVFTRSGNVVATTGDYTVAQITGAAPLANPAFTGAPTAPTQTIGDNSTNIATTAYADRIAVTVTTAVVTTTGTVSHGVEFLNATGGGFTRTLPTAVGSSSQYRLKAITTNNNIVLISTTSSQTIEGSAPPLQLGIPASGAPWESIDVVSDGSNWWIL